MWEITYKGRVRGPISDGRMTRWAREYSEDCAEAIADEAKKVWVGNLRGSIRHPTPHYWTMINVHELTPTRYRVDDHDIVYGPWLEGTGSRNAPVTVFPGYWSLRRAQETMKRKRTTVARKILREYRAQGKLI